MFLQKFSYIWYIYFIRVQSVIIFLALTMPRRLAEVSDVQVNPSSRNHDGLQVPSYAEVLSRSPSGMMHGERGQRGSRSSSMLALYDNDRTGEQDVLTEQAASVNASYSDEDDDDGTLFGETLRRGNLAQAARRRRRVTSRPSEGIEFGYQAQDGDTFNDIGGQLNWVSARSLDTVIDSSPANELRSPSPDPLALLPHTSRLATMARRTSQRRNAHTASSFPPVQDSIFFPPSPQRNPAPPRERDSISSLLAAQLNRPPAPLPSRRTELFRSQSRLNGGKPVLLLYCHAPSLKSRTASPDLPHDFYYINSPSPASSTSASNAFANGFRQQNEASIESPLPYGGGGCGRLLCARAYVTSEPDVFESDTPPISTSVDWLDIVSSDEGTSRSRGQEMDRHGNIWPDCTCVKANLGCRAWFVFSSACQKG